MVGFLVAVPVPAQEDSAGEGVEAVPAAAFAHFDTTVIPESSGLVKSRRQENVFWTLNDSGNSPRLFALSREGEILGVFTVSAVANRDWEAVAIDDAGQLYIGDIGNNASMRRDLTVLVVDEPTIGQSEPVRVKRRIPFRYPGQRQPPAGEFRNFDAESLFWTGGELYLLTKHREDTRTRLMRFDQSQDAARLVEVGVFDLGEAGIPRGGMATGADVTADGRHLAVLSYYGLRVFELAPGADAANRDQSFFSQPPVVALVLAPLVAKQCEGVAWDGPDLLVTNEQGSILRFEGVLAPDA